MYMYKYQKNVTYAANITDKMDYKNIRKVYMACNFGNFDWS